MPRKLHFGRLLSTTVVCALLLACAARVEPPTPSESEVLRARVEQIRDDPSFAVFGAPIAARQLVADFYARRGFTRAWTAPGARDDLLLAVYESEADGLDPEDYLLSALLAARMQGEAADASLDVLVDYDLLQTEALIRLLYHLIFGKVDPKSLDPSWNFTRNVEFEDPTAFVQAFVDSGELYARIEREKPQHEMYRNLKAELARHRVIASSGGWAAIPDGPTLKPGTLDPRVLDLRARLEVTAELPGAAPPDALVYDAAVAAAVSAYQARHGIDADGALGPATLAALNAPIEAHIEAIRVNLERGRWLLRDLDSTFVVVNVAGFGVYYLRDGKVVWTSRAVVGMPYRETPVFRSMMTYLVLNPTWTVPPSILAQDILPEQRRDRTTLARKRLEVIDRDGRRVDESSIDWASATPGNFPYMLRQQPGPDNALGRVKFMFPNPHSVYLHDTPSKALFEKSERAFSSGCIRIENPLELAELLLEGQDGWDRAALESAIETGTTRTVGLARPVPVLVAYWTTWVDRYGALQHRPDIYGRDAKVAAGLDAPFSFRP
jgi:murein L,D-transpeptidase YcbB/YkuD